MKNNILHLPSTILLAFAAAASISYSQDTASTDPVGFVTVTIPGGVQGAAKISLISLPLYDSVSDNFVGSPGGKISSLTGNTLTLDNAGWSDGALSAQGNPYFVQITSGNGEGRIVQITGNSTVTLTINNDGVDLNSNVSAGDTFEIFPGDTILSAFGTPDTETPADGVIGGSHYDINTTDAVIILDGVWTKYYYNTDRDQWEQPGLDFLGSQNTVVIPPHAGVIYNRVSDALSMVFTGRVPMSDANFVIPGDKTAFLSAVSPVGDTLGGLGIENMPNWKAVGDTEVTSENADLVFILGNAWAKFYYDRIQNKWFAPGLEFLDDQSAILIPEGTGVLVSRSGSPTANLFKYTLPYLETNNQ